MKHTLSVHAPTILAGMTTPALAGPGCLAPMTEWKPREIRVEKLRAEGWTIRRLTADDGCHKPRHRRGGPPRQGETRSGNAETRGAGRRRPLTFLWQSPF